MKKALSLLIFILISQPAQADIILLKNGEIIEGKITQVRGIFLRVESDYRQPFREFLMENVASIELTDPDEVGQLAVISLHNRVLNQVREKRLQEAINQKASSLIEEVIQSADGITLNEISDKGKTAAQQKANTLIEEAVITGETPSLEKTPMEVQGVVKTKATGLIQQAVHDVEVNPLYKAPAEVQVAAKKAASALIEEAVSSSNAKTQNKTFDRANTAIAVEKIDAPGGSQVEPLGGDALRQAIARQYRLLSEIDTDFANEPAQSVYRGLSVRDQILYGMIIILLGLLLLQRIRYRQAAQAAKEAESGLLRENEIMAPKKADNAPAKEQTIMEKRRHARAQCQISGLLILDKLRSIPVALKNISIGGACAICENINELRKLGDGCQYRFNIASKDPNFNLGGRVEVVRIKSDRDLGLRFIDLDKDSADQVRRFCHQ